MPWGWFGGKGTMEISGVNKKAVIMWCWWQRTNGCLCVGFINVPCICHLSLFSFTSGSLTDEVWRTLFFEELLNYVLPYSGFLLSVTSTWHLTKHFYMTILCPSCSHFLLDISKYWTWGRLTESLQPTFESSPHARGWHSPMLNLFLWGTRHQQSEQVIPVQSNVSLPGTHFLCVKVIGFCFCCTCPGLGWGSGVGGGDVLV